MLFCNYIFTILLIWNPWNPYNYKIAMNRKNTTCTVIQFLFYNAILQPRGNIRKHTIYKKSFLHII